MKRINVIAVVVGSLAAGGCGAAQLAMKGPISDQCASAGLKGCPALTEAVMAYVGGDEAIGEKKLRAVAAANNPEQLRTFASALAPIGSSIGGDAGAALVAVAAILRGDAIADPPAAKAGATTTASARLGASIGSAGLVAASFPPNVVLDELRSGTERLASDPRATACGGIFGGDPKCSRVRVFVGPLVVTNAYTSGGCPDDLILIAGRLDKPHWVLLNPAGAAMNVSGQFILEDGEELFAGVRPSAATPKDDVKCAITWSGFRPISAPTKKVGRYLDD